MNQNIFNDPSIRDGVSHELYWINKLSGSLPDTRFMRPSHLAVREPAKFEYLGFEVPFDSASMLFKMAKGSGLSTYMLLVSAMTVLLSACNHSERVLIGSPAYKDENWDGIDNLVPLLFNVDHSLSFKEYLVGQVKPTVVEAYANQSYPFQKLITDRFGQALSIRIIMLLENISSTCDLENMGGDIAFSFLMDQRNISCRVRYDANLYSKAQVTGGTKVYLEVLRWLLYAPQMPLRDVSLVPEDGKSAILTKFNNTERPLPSDESFAELFEEQVTRTPDSIAAISGTHFLTYRELSNAADNLAARLVSHGVGPDTVVAILSQRTLDLLVSILAVFKSGGAYLPLDPSNPHSRIKHILSESKTVHLLVDNGCGDELLNELESVAVQGCLTTIRIQDTVASNQPPCRQDSLPGALAYVIYTSGSTGTSKGAMVHNLGMLNHLYCKVDDLRLSEADSVAQTASQCFDISVWQFLAGFLVGGKVHIIPDEIAHDPLRLLSYVESNHITVVETVPSMLLGLIAALDSETGLRPPLLSLRWLIATGEALPPRLCHRWQEMYPNVGLLNAYGPTECSDDVTHFFIDESTDLVQGYVPIGRPVSNTSIYITQSHLRLLPEEIPGEILVGGAGVGRGYLHWPDRTAEVFIPDPFGRVPGARVYRSGDIGLLRNDWNIEFLGRSDFQVKIRGFRIELGEVETALRDHPAVREAIVVALQDPMNGKTLVAYLTAHDRSRISAQKLQSFLQNKLVEYMIPSAFVILDSLPLNSNGKVDRGKLPPPEAQVLRADQPYIPPRTPVEAALVEIWGRVLDVDNVGVQDNFFELGGDSIRAILVTSEAKERGIQLTPRHIFKHQTIADIAEAIEQKIDMAAGQSLSNAVDLLTPSQRSILENNSQNSTESILYTPTDFPDAQLSQKELDILIKSLS
jgi:amino acid adenylation domain-containing protein